MSSDAAQAKVAAFLKARAQAIGSRYLNLIAARAVADPFKKVKKMIRDLIVKLMEEANSEADHKAWCDTELATNKQTREIKTEAVDELTSEIEKLTADIAKLSQEISDLQDAITEIDKAMAEATEQRTAEKEKNANTVKDAKEGQEAVSQAL